MVSKTLYLKVLSAEMALVIGMVARHSKDTVWVRSLRLPALSSLVNCHILLMSSSNKYCGNGISKHPKHTEEHTKRRRLREEKPHVIK